MRRVGAALGAVILMFAAAPPVSALASECLTIGGNLLANCGFETGNATGWTQGGDLSNTTVLTATVHGGSYGYYANPTGTGLGTLSQTVTTQIGHAYAARFWIRGGASNSSWSIDLYEGSTQISGEGGSGPITDWTVEVDQHLVWVATSTSATIRFSFWGGDAGFYFDDVTVKEVPLMSDTTALKAKGKVTLSLNGTVGWTSARCYWTRSPEHPCTSAEIKTSSKQIHVKGSNDGGLTWGPFALVAVTRA